jgi:hypothetical protein
MYGMDGYSETTPYMKKKSKFVIVSDTGDLMKHLYDLGCDNAHTINKSVDSVAHMKKKYSDLLQYVKQGDLAVTMSYENCSISYFIFTELTIYRYEIDARFLKLSSIG